jgi:hypothetical protein
MTFLPTQAVALRESGARDRAWYVGMAAAFGLSRLLYRMLAGIRFDTTPQDYFTQIVDPQFLRAEFWTSLLYLHAQPPLFNFLIGAVDRLSPDPVLAFGLIYAGLGLVIQFSLFRLLRALGLLQPAAAVTATAFAVSPTVLLYENWLFYSYPVAAGFCLAAVLFSAAVAHGRFASLLALFIVMAALCLIRSSFHLVWIAFWLAGLIVLRPALWRRATLAAAVPLLLVGALYAKNGVLFSTWSSSSWLGLSLAKMTAVQLEPDKAAALVGSGRVSPAALLPVWSRVPEYAKLFPMPPPSGALVLDEPLKWTRHPISGEPVPNYNHAIYPAVSAQRAKDALAIMRIEPLLYAGSVAAALKVYLTPPSYDTHLAPTNHARIDGLVAVVDTLTYGAPSRSVLERLGIGRAAKPLAGLSLSLILGFALIAAGTLVTLRDVLRARTMADPRDALYLFLGLNIAGFSLVYTMLDIGENNRFRFEIEPLILAAAVAAGARWLRARRRALAGQPVQGAQEQGE